MTHMRRFSAFLLCFFLLFAGCAAKPAVEAASTAAEAPTTGSAAASASAAAPQTAPAAPQTAPTATGTTSAASVCTLIVRCDTILDKLDALNPEKLDLVPEDGLLYENPAAEMTDGESAFDLLLREMRAAAIHLDFVKTPAYNTVYIKGIGNLYEFDCGDLSGWTYRINGEFLSVGCSLAVIHPGDTVEFLYTCDLGADVGNVWTGE